MIKFYVGFTMQKIGRYVIKLQKFSTLGGNLQGVKNQITFEKLLVIPSTKGAS